MPEASLPELGILLSASFPDAPELSAAIPNMPNVSLGVGGLALPGLPNVSGMSGVTVPGMPSVDMALVLAQLKLKCPTVDWPALPTGAANAFALPDWSMPGVNLPDLMKELRVKMPDLNLPDLPELNAPDFQMPTFELKQLIMCFKLKFPCVDRMPTRGTPCTGPHR